MLIALIAVPILTGASLWGLLSFPSEIMAGVFSGLFALMALEAIYLGEKAMDFEIMIVPEEVNDEDC
jgi:hypothetical protein